MKVRRQRDNEIKKEGMEQTTAKGEKKEARGKEEKVRERLKQRRRKKGIMKGESNQKMRKQGQK